MPPRTPQQTAPSPQRAQLATAIVAGAAILLVGAAMARVPGTLPGLLPALIAQALHLVAAFSAGRFLTRLPRAAPKGALGIIVTSLALGFAFVALLTLAFALFGLVRWWTPWAVDLIALLLGITRLSEAIERLREPLGRQEHALLVGFRVPLFAALGALILLHVSPALLPPTADTGVAGLSLASQASLRGDLSAALAALPDTVATPSQALLLHGHLAAGAVGARLHGVCLVLLLTAAVFLAALRRFGPRVAAWSVIILLSVPWFFESVARDPSAALIALFGFLALREVSDWLIDGTGGKIALASAYGGVLVAESAGGAAAFATILMMLFITQALVEREGVLRALGGVAAMTGVALAVALPFVGMAVALDNEPIATLEQHWVSAPLADHWAHLTHVLPNVEEAGLLAHAADMALRLGPLLLGLLLLLFLTYTPAAALRHALLAMLMGVLACLAPPPYAAPVMLIAPASLLAAIACVSALARRGAAAALVLVFASLGLLASILLMLVSGPDVGAGLSVLVGRQDPARYIEERVPDAALIADIATRQIPEGDCVLLVGEMTDAYYTVPVRRLDRPVTAEALQAALRTEPRHVALVAWNLAEVSPDEVRALGALPVLATHGSRLLLDASGGRR